MHQLTLQRSDKLNPQTTALPSPLIKIFFWEMKEVRWVHLGRQQTYTTQIAVNDPSFVKKFYTWRLSINIGH